MWIWLCEGKLKVKISHFWLQSASQKRACLSFLIFWGARHAQLLCVEKFTQNFDLWFKQKPCWVLVCTPYLLDKHCSLYYFLVIRGRRLYDGGVYLNFNFFLAINSMVIKSVKRVLKYTHFELKNTVIKESKVCLSWTTVYYSRVLLILKHCYN